MIKITKHFDLYSFDELSEEAQDRAISEHIDFLLETFNPDKPGFIEDSVKEAKEMLTPWFAGSYVYDMHKQDVIAEIKLNEYLFFQDGELIPLDFYPKERG